MGLLIFQRKEEGWFCSIQEEWVVDTIEETSKILSYLMDNMIQFRISYSFELIHIHFEKSIYSQKDYKAFKLVIDKLMSFKEKYGDFKDVSELKEKSFRGIKESDITGGKLK